MYHSLRFPLCCSLLVVVLVGCSGATEPATESSDADGFQQLVAASVEELRLKNESHKAWGMGSFDRWDLDQEAGTLEFSNADGTTAVARAQVIGSFSTNDNSWLWAWDNPSILESMKLDAFELKAYGEEHGVDKLTTRKWTGTEEEAWEMAAVAVKLCDAQGAYRGPAGPAYVYITFGKVTISKPAE